MDLRRGGVNVEVSMDPVSRWRTAMLAARNVRPTTARQAAEEDAARELLDAAIEDGLRDPGDGPPRPARSAACDVALPPEGVLPEPVRLAVREYYHAAVRVLVGWDGTIYAEHCTHEMVQESWRPDPDDPGLVRVSPTYERKLVRRRCDVPNDLTAIEVARGEEIAAQQIADYGVYLVVRAAYERARDARDVARRAWREAEDAWSAERHAYLESCSLGERLAIIRRHAGDDSDVTVVARWLAGWSGCPAGLLDEIDRTAAGLVDDEDD